MTIESVLVTGGGSGIGAALAAELARRNCQVLITGRRQHALERVASGSDRMTRLAGDITDPSHRAALVEGLSALPAPRAVFHGAGHFQTGLLEHLSDDDWRRSFATNVEARWILSRDCAPILEDGRILFIGSDAGANPRVGAAAYSIAQSASETLRRALQAEWAQRPIGVGAFKPGLVDTDMVRGFMALSAEEFPARAVYADYVARGRVASPAAVASFAAWLLLDVPTVQFTQTEWDIRETSHHHEWSTGPLYPDAD
jgi:NAD(P)-dependent dehydrogenase (short-subunit alcohol dehydrogenase family)